MTGLNRMYSSLNTLAIKLTLLVCCTLGSFYCLAEAEKNNNTITAIIHTSKGEITLELYPDKAPITVQNFIDYAESGFYNKTIFHRVIKRFMIQGGGFTRDLNKKPTKDPIINEAGNGLFNDRWTIAMARTPELDSATSQFFINTRMNTKLDTRGDAYAVFGKVTGGEFVVKAIEKSPTATIGEHANVPVEPVFIERVEIKR